MRLFIIILFMRWKRYDESWKSIENSVDIRLFLMSEFWSKRKGVYAFSGAKFEVMLTELCF